MRDDEPGGACTGLRKRVVVSHLARTRPATRDRSTVPRYSYRRLSALPATEEGLRRYVVLNAPEVLGNVALRHTVMQPGAVIPAVPEDVSQLFVTISGRGVMRLDGDRVEVSANEVVFVPAGCACGLETLGGTPWVYLLAQSGG
jgi:mannose-6-phosphate isomerase-like protein (cupin superfamily)